MFSPTYSGYFGGTVFVVGLFSPVHGGASVKVAPLGHAYACRRYITIDIAGALYIYSLRGVDVSGQTSTHYYLSDSCVARNNTLFCQRFRESVANAAR